MGRQDSGLNVDLRSESIEVLESVSTRLHVFADILGWLLYPAFVLYLFGFPLIAISLPLAVKLVFPIFVLYHLALGVLFYYGYVIVRWSYRVLREPRNPERHPIEYQDSNFETVYSVGRANFTAFLEGGSALLLFIGLLLYNYLWLFTDIPPDLLPEQIPLRFAVQVIDAIFNTRLAILADQLEIGALLLLLLLVPIIGCYFVFLANVRDVLERTRKQELDVEISIWRHLVHETLNTCRLLLHLSKNLLNQDAGVFWSLSCASVKILLVLLVFIGLTNVMYT